MKKISYFVFVRAHITYTVDLDYTALRDLVLKARRNKNNKTKVGPVVVRIESIRETDRSEKPRRMVASS